MREKRRKKAKVRKKGLRKEGGREDRRGKSNEGMGWIGRSEGLAVTAVALLDQIGDIDALHASIRAGG